MQPSEVHSCLFAAGMKNRQKKYLPGIFFVCVCVHARKYFLGCGNVTRRGRSWGMNQRLKQLFLKKRDTNYQNKSASDPFWLLKAACLCLQIDLKTVNNLFSQMIFNHPLKYLCCCLCGVVSFRIWDGHKQQEEGRKKKGGTARKKINKQAKHRDRTVWGWTLLILTPANANANACLSNM